METLGPVLSDEPSVSFTTQAISDHVTIALDQMIDAGWRHLPLSPSLNHVAIRYLLLIRVQHAALSEQPRACLAGAMCAGLSALSGLPVRYWSCVDSLSCISKSRGTNSAFHQTLTLTRAHMRPLQSLLSFQSRPYPGRFLFCA